MNYKLKLSETPLSILLEKVAHLARHQCGTFFQAYDLMPSAVGILLSLEKHGALSQRELADRVGITPPSITVALRKMENQGYVKKRPDQYDQRVIRIELQEAGRECLEKLHKNMKQVEESVFHGFTQEEKILMRRFLIQMYENIMEQNNWSEEELKRCFPPMDMMKERHHEKID